MTPTNDFKDGIAWALRVVEAYMDECSDDEEGQHLGAHDIYERLTQWLDRSPNE